MYSTRRSVLFVFFIALVGAICFESPDAGAAWTAAYPFNTHVTVVNTNGIPQAATQIMDLSRGTKVGVSDTNGNAVVGVNVPTAVPAWTDVVSATRQVPEYAGDPCWAVPEHSGVGVPLWSGAFDQLPASTVTVPAINGVSYQPETSSDEWSLLTLINEKRGDAHVSPVTLSTVLSASAASYVNILPGTPLNLTSATTYCMNSGPGIRAIDAGFPTFDVGEDVVQGASTPDAALASIQSYDNAGLLTDPDMTMVGIASKDGSWVIDTSILGLSDPGYDRAGDTGNTAPAPAVPPVCSPGSTSTSPCPPVSPVSCPPSGASTRLPKLKLLRIEHHRHSLVVYAKLRPQAKGKIRISAIRAPLHHRLRLHAKPVLGRHLHRRCGHVHATLHLRPGRWRVRVRFLGKGSWDSIIRRRTVIVHRPRNVGADRHRHRHG